MNPLARKAVQVGARVLPRIVKRIADRRAAKGGRLVLWWRRNFGEIDADQASESAEELAGKGVDALEERKRK